MNSEVIGVDNVIRLSSARASQSRRSVVDDDHSVPGDRSAAFASSEAESVDRRCPAPAAAMAGSETAPLFFTTSQPVKPTPVTPNPMTASRPPSTRRAEGNVEETMLEQLDRRERLRLVEFVCSFAWADLEIRPEERVFISRLISRLELDEEENLQVQQWLDRPPGIDDLDPTSIPKEHRRIFVDAVEGLISADGEISDEERDSFEIFKQLIGA